MEVAFFSWLITFAGFVIIWYAYLVESEYGTSRMPIGTFLLTGQHLALGLMGSIGATAIQNLDYYYGNWHGTFLWLGSLLPMQQVHLFSMLVGLSVLLTMRWFTTGANPFTFPRGANPNWRDAVNNAPPAVTRFILVMMAAVIPGFVMAAVTVAAGLPDAVAYPFQTLFGNSGAAGATLFLAGLYWNSFPRLIRQIVVWTIVPVALLTLASGDRGVGVEIIAAIVLGRMVTMRVSDVTPFRVAAVAGTLVLGATLFTGSAFQREEGGRELGDDPMARVVGLFGFLNKPARISDEGSFEIGNNPNHAQVIALRISMRACEMTAMDIITRTPDWVPFRGWTDGDTRVVLSGLLPAGRVQGSRESSGRTVSGIYELGGNYALVRYGWQTDADYGFSSMPLTLIGDLYTRWGLAGVGFGYALFYFLFTLPGLVVRKRPEAPLVLFLGALFISQTPRYYAFDITYWLTTPYRRIILCLILASFALWVSRRLGATAFGIDARAKEPQPVAPTAAPAG